MEYVQYNAREKERERDRVLCLGNYIEEQATGHAAGDSREKTERDRGEETERHKRQGRESQRHILLYRSSS